MDLNKKVSDEQYKTRTIWHDIDDASFQIRFILRIPKAVNILRNSTAKASRNKRGITYETEKDQAVRLVRDFALVDWANLYNGEKEFEYTDENVNHLLTNYSDITFELLDAATDQALFTKVEEKEEEDKKN